MNPEATQVLASMPGVLEAVAFCVPYAAMGERLVAAIVPAPDHVIAVSDAAAFCRTALAPEKAPRDFRIVSALPRNAAGKKTLVPLN